MNRLKKIIIYLPTFIFIFLFIPHMAYASGISISYPGAPGPVFNEKNLAPGSLVEKTITIKNNEQTNQNIGFRITKGASEELSNNLSLSVIKNNQLIVGPKTLTEFYGYLNETYLGVLGAEASADYVFRIGVNPNIGNDYQGKTEIFDMSLGFIATESTSDNGSNPLTRQLSYLLGAFGAGTTETTIISPATPDSTIKGDVAEDENEVKGKEEGNNSNSLKSCPWWWIILILEALFLLLIYLIRYRDIKDAYWPLWGVVIGILALLAHELLARNYVPTIYCKWFWLMDLLLVLIYSALIYFASKEGKEEENKG